jgi:hypothetical protein
MIEVSNYSRLIAKAIAVILTTTSCAQTTYVGLENDDPMPGGAARIVGVQIDHSFIDEFPDCTIIMEPDTGPGLQQFKPMVEEALGRHLTRKFTRVIDATERRRISRKSALDLRHREDRIDLAKISDCDTLLRARVVGPGKTYLLVWSQMQVGIEVIMMRVHDSKMLWRARHMADRSEGGIPFSPIGIVVDAYSSVQFSSDREISESVIDDAVRRIVRSIPNSRQLSTVSQRGLRRD